MDMSAEDRLALLMAETEDVAREDQIVLQQMAESASAAGNMSWLQRAKDAVMSVFRHVDSGDKTNFTKAYAGVPAWLSSLAKKHADIDITGYSHIVDTSAVGHIRKHYDSNTETSRGLLPISDADVVLMPEIINNPDYVVFGAKDKDGRDAIVYVKNASDNSTYFVEVVRGKKKRVLAAKTMYKMPGTSDERRIRRSPSLYAQSDADAVIKIIANPSAIGNEENALYQAAWHGTPHRFDKFTLSAIGSGVGDQVHGWGLYFAGRRSLSEAYRENLLGNARIQLKYEHDDSISNSEEIDKTIQDIQNRLNDSGERIDEKNDVLRYIYYVISACERKIAENNNIINLIDDVTKTIENQPDITFSDILTYTIDYKSKISVSDKLKLYNLSDAKDQVRRVFSGYIANMSHDTGVRDFDQKASLALSNLTRIRQDAENSIARQEQTLKQYQSLDASKITFTLNKGQLFKVDIPNNNVLLDEQKTFSKQSSFVQNAVKSLLDSLPDEQLEDFGDVQRLGRENVINNTMKQFMDSSGGNVYGTLSSILGSDKAASLKLNDYGVKGITYVGRRDGRCFVVFDDEAINVLETYYQTRGGMYRGAIVPPTEAGWGQPAVMSLGPNDDMSTVMHETAHFYYFTLRSMAKQFGRIEDLDVISNWLGEHAEDNARWVRENVSFSEEVRAGAAEEAFNAWLVDAGAVSPELAKAFDVASQEYFARGFEAYLREGRAPTLELRGMFRRFKAWLCDIYRSLADLDVELSDEVRSVFDRMLASDEAIEAYRFDLETAEAAEADLPPDELSVFDDDDVYESAKERLLGRLLDEVTPERRAEMMQFAEDSRPEVAAVVTEEPHFQMMRLMTEDEGNRINSADIVALFGTETLARMPEGTTSPDGMSLEMAVRNLGFGSAKELISDLLDGRTEKEEVDARVQALVAAKYPSAIANPELLDAETLRAMYEGPEREDEIAADIFTSETHARFYDRYAAIYEADEAAHRAEEDPGSRRNVLAWIKSHGKIKYASVKTEFGAEPAAELMRRLGLGAFNANGYGLDELARRTPRGCVS